MGGSVFTRGINRLYVPRLAPPVYRLVRSQLSATLSPLFSRITKPVDGPNKTDHGDIDLLLSLEGSTFDEEQKKDPRKTDIWAAVEKALAPTRTHQDSIHVVNSRSFALPWPKEVSGEEMIPQLALEARQLAEERAAAKERAIARADARAKAEVDATVDVEVEVKAAERSKSSSTPGPWTPEAVEEDAVQPDPEALRITRHVQVDIRLCDTTQELEWQKFKNSHGPLWLLLGSSMRPLGLLVDNHGLQLSLNDHDKSCPRYTRLFLTNSPTRVLDFLGLSHAKGEWNRPFKSVTELIDYVKTYRFYHPRGPFAKGPLKAKFIRMQPQLFDHLDEVQTAESAPEESPPATLEDVRRAVFSTFPGTEEAYAAKVAKWSSAKQEQTWVESVKRVIKTDRCLPQVIHPRLLPPVPQGGSIQDVEQAWRAVLRAALRRLLLSGDSPAQMMLCVQPPKFDYRTPIPAVVDWISCHWKKIGEEAWGRVQKQLAWRHDQASGVAPGEALVKFTEPTNIWQKTRFVTKRLEPVTGKLVPLPVKQGDRFYGMVRLALHSDAGDDGSIGRMRLGTTWLQSGAQTSSVPKSSPGHAGEEGEIGENHDDDNDKAAAQQDEGSAAQAKSEVAMDSATQHNESTAVEPQSEAASDSPRGEQQS